jgi:hypothetical protein
VQHVAEADQRKILSKVSYLGYNKGTCCAGRADSDKLCKEEGSL